MRRHLLTLLLMLAGITAWAQSGWTDPGNAYQQATVVYATLNAGSNNSTAAPEIAAFIDGEIRAVTSSYQQNDIGNIYTLRIGGTDDDKGSAITFKLYDPTSGLVYPLSVADAEGAAAEIDYQGDFSYATQNEDGTYSITLHTLSATPAESVKVTYTTSDGFSCVPVNVGQTVKVEDYVTFSFETASGATPTTPEYAIEWDLSAVQNSGQPSSYYVNVEQGEDGNNLATGLNAIDYTVPAFAKFGNLGAQVDFYVTQPITSMEIEDAEIYLGVGRFVPNVVFNNGESVPSNTNFTLSVENEDVVSVYGSAIIPNAFGSAVVTATSEEYPEITATFTVTVVSALQSMDKGFDTDVYEYTRWSAGEEIIDLPNPGFNWLTREDGKPVISDTDESYTITSSDPTVIRIDKQETEEGTEIRPMSLKKGTAQITYTSNYDPSKSVTFTVVVKQGIQEIAITEVNSVEIVGMDQTVDVTVGETIVARAEVAPLDADYEEFTMQFVDANWGIVEKIEDYVEILSSEVVDGICTFEFKFIQVPETGYYLQAVIDNDSKSSIVGINVYDVVESIDVYMNPEYWLTEDENIFEFKYNVNPDNVLDPSLRLESSNPDVAEVLMSEDAGMYRIHAYSTGEVTFTFTSVSNPSVSTQVTVVIKRQPTGVAIKSVGAVEIPEPGTTPTETVVDIAVGQTVVAVAGVIPDDATIDSYSFSVVNSDGIEYEADVVTVGEVVDNNDGTWSLEFTFNTTVDDASILFTVNDELSHRVSLNIIQSVTEIVLSETEMTVWYSEGIETFINIAATVLPDDATNKEIEISVDADGILQFGAEADGAYTFSVVGKGTVTVTFASVDNPSVKATCVVTVKKHVDYIEVIPGFEYEMYNDGTVYNATLTYSPEDADFDIEGLHVNAAAGGMPEGWSVLDIELGDMMDGELQIILTPRALCSGIGIEFTYSNPAVESGDAIISVIEAAIKEKITVTDGWNWISMISPEPITLGELFTDGLIEARSQSQLVFNDANWGLFGDLSELDNTQAYKLNMSSYVEVYPWSSPNVEGTIASKELKKGWNWVSYPYEYNYLLEQIFDASMFSANDMILSKSGEFAQINADGVWEGTLVDLIPYQGYMVYCNADVELPMLGRYDLEQGYFYNSGIPRSPSREPMIWNYDNSRFANVMAIVAKVDIENCEDYSIGAFVGDECRGEGKFINGKAFIGVGGESGEVVTFRLYNKWTGELLDIAQEIPFGDMAGSISAPVVMGVLDGTTGIENAGTVEGDIEAIYDITGRKVERMTEGIYVIKVREGDKIVTKKVRK